MEGLDKEMEGLEEGMEWLDKGMEGLDKGWDELSPKGLLVISVLIAWEGSRGIHVQGSPATEYVQFTVDN